MIIVVDSNILFSACISRYNKIAEILFNPLPNFQRVSSYYAIVELFKHKKKINKLSKLSEEKFIELLYALLRQVEFLNENMIDSINWREEDRLTAGIDSNDIAFVALTLQKDGFLWTGDKKLIDHLKRNGLNNVIDTTELYKML